MHRAANLIVMDQGKIAACGTVSNLLDKSEYVKSLNMGTSKDQPAGDDTTSKDDVGEDSEASSNQKPAKTAEKKNTMDDLRRKTGDWSVYSYYFSRAGKWTCWSALVLSSIWTGCQEFSSKQNQLIMIVKLLI